MGLQFATYSSCSQITTYTFTGAELGVGASAPKKLGRHYVSPKMDSQNHFITVWHQLQCSTDSTDRVNSQTKKNL